MSDVRPFNQNRVLEFLKNKELQYVVDDDGDYSFLLDIDDMSMIIYAMVRGQDNNVLNLLCLRDQEYRPAQLDQVLRAVNQFNREHRWPTVYVNASELEADEPYDVRTEWNVDLGPGVHQALLDDMIETFVSATIQFWRWMRDEHDLG